jgi:quercetin dioxygenase-like cupin family protein
MTGMTPDMPGPAPGPGIFVVDGIFRDIRGQIPGQLSYPCRTYPQHRKTMTGKPDEPPAGDKKREELVGRVLVINDLLRYQDGAVASRMIVFRKTGTITLFAFDAGEGLSEHSAPFDAVLAVTDGEAEVSIAGKPFTVRNGEMIILPANIPHSVQAIQRFRMTLTMIRE